MNSNQDAGKGGNVGGGFAGSRKQGGKQKTGREGPERVQLTVWVLPPLANSTCPHGTPGPGQRVRAISLIRQCVGTAWSHRDRHAGETTPPPQRRDGQAAGYKASSWLEAPQCNAP